MLVGHNGAGKSTLIRILCGADTDFDGEIWCDERRLRLGSPRDGHRAGIHVIHQELSLVESLSATDNWLLAEDQSWFSWVARGDARNKAQKACDRLGLTVDLEVPVGELALSERQLLEIARATADRSSVLVLDEPTSALSEAEAKRLLVQLRGLRETGTAILYVSHRMEEIYEIADRVSVLRDGVLVVTRPASELPRTELVRAMLGQEAQSVPVRSDIDSDPKELDHQGLLTVRSLQAEGRPPLRGLSFQVKSGEILGVCGLCGSGASELLQVMGGAREMATGSLDWDGTGMSVQTPARAIRSGIVYLPADRKRSVLPALSLLDNGTLSALGDYCRWGFLRDGERRSDVARLAAVMGLSAPSLDAPASSLSGGNQQRLALLRCLLAKPKVLLLDEPTRGVDVAAKQAVHGWIRRVTSQGMAVVIQSPELDELMELCEQVLVMSRGRIVAELRRSDFGRERLLHLMMGNVA